MRGSCETNASRYQLDPSVQLKNKAVFRADSTLRNIGMYLSLSWATDSSTVTHFPTDVRPPGRSWCVARGVLLEKVHTWCGDSNEFRHIGFIDGPEFLCFGTAKFHVGSDELFSLSPDVLSQQLNLLIGWLRKSSLGTGLTSWVDVGAVRAARPHSGPAPCFH